MSERFVENWTHGTGDPRNVEKPRRLAIDEDWQTYALAQEAIALAAERRERELREALTEVSTGDNAKLMRMVARAALAATSSEGQGAGEGYPAGHPDTTGWSDLDDWDYMTTNSLIEGGWLPPDEAEKLRADAEALAEALEGCLQRGDDVDEGPWVAINPAGLDGALAALARYRGGEQG